MSVSSGSSRAPSRAPAPRRRLERLAPVVVVVLVALLTGLSLGTGWLVVRHFHEDAESTSRLYSEVFSGLNNPRPGAETDALLALGEQVRRLGMPLVVTDAADRVTAYDNLPFEPSSIDDPRLHDFVQRLDREYPPISDSLIGTVHYGAMPARFQLTALVVLQALTIAVMVGVAVFAYRSAIDAQRDRLWVAMAREAAHQMGTPLTSLQGWIERIRSIPDQPQLADHLSADAERLDRVARRFERIGNPAAREPIGLGALADRVAGYFRPRLPKWANQIELRVEAAGAGPTILGDPVLLEWALEALVKNAIDALQGRPGTIILRVETDQKTAAIRVLDDGPGIPKEIRREIFEPGITTKRGGWGIGLALSRRVVEEAHHGELTLESAEKGTCFLIRIPLAEAPA
jgi:two-component system, sporulation sensor kinase D